jgi:uncharacterized protein
VIINQEFEVAQPLEKVWTFFGDVPQVASCLPGAQLDQDLGNGEYAGTVGVRMGPVKLQFNGKAKILDRDDATKKMVIDASGAEVKGRGQAAMKVTAQLTSAGGASTKVAMAQDLELAGAAAQYGRGMIADVTAVLMKQFAANVQDRIAAIDRGEDPAQLRTAQASGLAIGLQAARLALMRVFRRFFLPYRPVES